MPDAQQPAVELKAAKARAREQLSGVPGVEGFGIGDRCLRIYVRDEATARKIPREISGVPIVAVVSGVIQAL